MTINEENEKIWEKNQTKILRDFWDSHKEFRTKFTTFENFNEWIKTRGGLDSSKMIGPLNVGRTPLEIVKEHGLIILEFFDLT